MAEPIRMGVLGCADIARRRMLPAFAACPDTEVTAVAGRDAARAGETARPYGALAFGGYAELLADPSVDAVYVPVPLALHSRWVEAALRAGKHVLAEKPLTGDAGETERLFALAERQGRALMENVMFVHHGQHRRVRELLAEGAVGELRSFEASFTVPRRPDDDIRYRADLGGGALFDTGVYPLRAALHLLGPELSVAGAVLEHGPGFGVDTSGAVLLRTPKGVLAQLSFGLDHAYRGSYTLHGSTGRLTLDRVFTPPADLVPVARIEGPAGVREIPLAAEDQVAATVAAFAAACREGSAPSAQSLAQARLLDAVVRAARAAV
ncbi:Gfo/Idh/MocA family protein [Streptomyces yaizuensis]|uniref:Gfo/Idh/MocA family oxidoreductase n=1 Tax=Streptomyces yaizuensis TaxID=2989713 RepID=A0ABQ5PA33_9ACTN|nr:Gfo/Idh/MocA family oxidoreductase [Streptomyces sp. YSPA8]GLF99427.1 Gfo/Idh/MocA family oxidoreductase [Streptomyces sp. YSPA8]